MTKYDRDLGRNRWILVFLALLNLGTVVFWAWLGNWPMAFMGLVWSANFLYMARWNRQVQAGRDAERLLEAALQKALSER